VEFVVKFPEPNSMSICALSLPTNIFVLVNSLAIDNRMQFGKFAVQSLDSNGTGGAALYRALNVKPTVTNAKAITVLFRLIVS